MPSVTKLLHLIKSSQAVLLTMYPFPLTLLPFPKFIWPNFQSIVNLITIFLSCLFIQQAPSPACIMSIVFTSFTPAVNTTYFLLPLFFTHPSIVFFSARSTNRLWAVPILSIMPNSLASLAYGYIYIILKPATLPFIKTPAFTCVANSQPSLSSRSQNILASHILPSRLVFQLGPNNKLLIYHLF